MGGSEESQNNGGRLTMRYITTEESKEERSQLFDEETDLRLSDSVYENDLLHKSARFPTSESEESKGQPIITFGQNPEINETGYSHSFRSENGEETQNSHTESSIQVEGEHLQHNIFRANQPVIRNNITGSPGIQQEFLVAKYQWIQIMGESENEVKIAAFENLGFSGFEPSFPV